MDCNHFGWFISRNEIVLRCDREGNKVKAGIMTYSKVEKLFCSSKMFCTRDAEAAADDTCGY